VNLSEIFMTLCFHFVALSKNVFGLTDLVPVGFTMLHWLMTGQCLQGVCPKDQEG